MAKLDETKYVAAENAAGENTGAEYGDLIYVIKLTNNNHFFSSIKEINFHHLVYCLLFSFHFILAIVAFYTDRF